MNLPIQKFRELVLLTLYSKEHGDGELCDPAPMLMKELKVSRKNVYLAIDKASKILSKLTEIDPMIQQASTEYDLDRIKLLDKNIIRLALFELLYDDLDIKIAVSEAIRLGKKFSNMESSKFINAIIDNVYSNAKNASHARDSEKCSLK